VEVAASAAFVVLTVSVVALRRHLRGSRLVSAAIGWGGPLWIATLSIVWGVEMLPRSGGPRAAGFLMLVVGGISFILAMRGLLDPAAATLIPTDGDMSRRGFDYLIWVLLGVPLLMGVGLVLLVLLGQV
jgi:hypothetical protein